MRFQEKKNFSKSVIIEKFVKAQTLLLINNFKLVLNLYFLPLKCLVGHKGNNTLQTFHFLWQYQISHGSPSIQAVQFSHNSCTCCLKLLTPVGSSFLFYRVSTLVCWAPAWKVDGLEEAILLIRTLEKLHSDTKKYLWFSSCSRLCLRNRKKIKLRGKKKNHQNVFCFDYSSIE